MPLHFKIDWIATRQARRNGTLLSKESFISREKVVGKPGELEYHVGPHEKLAGADMRARYAELMKPDTVCSQCGRKGDRLELDHIVSRGRGGCDCKINLQALCWTFDGKGCHNRKTLSAKTLESTGGKR